MSSALHRIWVAAGSPEPNWAGRSKTPKPPPPSRHGVCALTGQVGEVVDIRHVLSDLFTTWDRLRWRHAPDAGLSIPAAWAFRHRPLQQQPHALTSTGFRAVQPSELFDALCTLEDDSFVSVPQSRQKHLVPFAELGTVRVDDRTLRWRPDDAHALGTYRGLRRLGFGETALTQPSPPWPTLSRLPTPEKRWVLVHWADLDQWRTDPDRLDVAARATRADKEQPNP